MGTTLSFISNIKMANSTSSIVYSVYIPRIHSRWTEVDIACLFETTQFGVVKRVDFLPIDNHTATTKRTDIIRAFVHFSEVYNTKYTLEILDAIDSGECFRQHISQEEFWMLLKNKNPVLETRLNIHQVVENATILEHRVDEYEIYMGDIERDYREVKKVVEEQAATIQRLEMNIGRLEMHIDELYVVSRETIQRLEMNIGRLEMRIDELYVVSR